MDEPPSPHELTHQPADVGPDQAGDLGPEPGYAPLVARHPFPQFVRRADLTAKAALFLMLVLALIAPDLGNMEGKGAGLRAIAYPMMAFAIPIVWYVWWRERASFPWLADLLVTITCFSDILGNRLDLYDAIWWFDDWMHFMNNGMLVGAIILLTLHRSATLGAVLERALAFGVTAALTWELAEYFAFISKSSELQLAYTDTLGDLTLGTMGSITAAVIIHASWQRGRIVGSAPHLDHLGHQTVER
ncbi:hypothetical protein [Aeromicrobium sp.]|uniref:hypothetical protein n=1 Tax=Aeromicrobium sp. TaxID=1871063 RepID=UPI002FC935C0